MKRKCASCGSEDLEPGRIQSTGRVYFRPKNARFLSLKSADIEIDGNICTECGFIMLFGDKGKVKALVSGREEAV
ncbi:MAG: hypothetical protein ACYSWQ_28005 [Planctomycetota bacterium]|jgi:hypothetical protein